MLDPGGLLLIRHGPSRLTRVQQVLLTAAAAAAVPAMIPLSRSVSWGPMAVAIMGGLIVATVLTLLSLPAAMYVAWFRVQRGVPRLDMPWQGGGSA